ncbi:hypothetical protein GWK47_013237 [Chionoecetes opilio]|uniref:Uncharacterized protein n=1 Tax=Chionoecetes opilio TaxID=41210 RepID=A0A8J4XWA4_CHIOP|nr:hypothetical protein GWK47_013237 [Chionoecetes opilio]
MLGRKLFWSICVLHTNELPCAPLITSIDGPTSSDTGFTGPGMAHHSPVARVHVDQKAWTDWQRTEHPGNPVKYCLQVYFKIYYDIKVHHRLEDGPKHILTQLRVMRSQPQKGPNSCDLLRADRGMVRTPRCFLLSLMASQSEDDRRFAIQEILVKPYEVPEFSIHTQSTERVVKQVTEAAAAGQRRGLSGSGHHRETMPCFRSKKDMMDTSRPT